MRGRTLRTGTTVVTVTFKNIKTAKSTAKKYRCVVKAALEQKPEEPTTTAAKITAIKQTSATKLAAEFSADMTGIKYTDLKIVRDKTGYVVTVKSASVDKADATKVTIETYEGLTDGETYTVTYTAADEAKTESSATFTATSGVVADIALNTYSIPANTPTTIKYQLLDANGVLIEENGIGKSKSNKVDISIVNFNGYQDDDAVTLYKTGDTATLKAVYHTWKYNNTNGDEEGKVEKELTITAVDPSSVIETYDFTVIDNTAVGTVDFKKDTLKTQIAVGDDKNPKDPRAVFSFRKADGTDITKSLDYTVSSGNENVLLASGNVADASGAQLTPIAVGATYLVIKNSAGNVVKTLPINVVAKRSLSTMTVDKSNVTVSAEMAAADASGKQVITIAVMDQHGDAYSDFVAENIERKTTTDPNGLIVDFNGAKNGNKIQIYASTSGVANVKPGTYTYTVDLRDTENDNNVKKVAFNVTVSKKTDTSNNSYALVMMNDAQDGVVNKVNTTVTTDDFTATTLHPTVVVKNNGSIVKMATPTTDIVSVGAMTLKKNGTAVSDKTVYTQTGKDYTITSTDDLDVMVTSGDGESAASPVIKHLEPGTYTVSLDATVKVGTNEKIQTMSTSFVVEDSQRDFAANVKKTSITDHTTIRDVFEDPKCVSYSYAGSDLTDIAPYYYADADYTKTNNDTRINVKKVFVNVKLPGTYDGTDLQWVRMTATVGRSFTFSNAIVSNKDDAQASIKAFNTKYCNADGTVKTGVNKDDLITSATAIVSSYDSLTDAEKNAISYYKMLDNTFDVALSALRSSTTSDISATVISWFDVTGYVAANQTAYATKIAGNTAYDAANIDYDTIQSALNADIAEVNAQANANEALAIVSNAAIRVTRSSSTAIECDFSVVNATVTVTCSSITSTGAIEAATATEVDTPASSGFIGANSIVAATNNNTVVIEWVIIAEGTALNGETTVKKTATKTLSVTYTYDGTNWTGAVTP